VQTLSSAITQGPGGHQLLGDPDTRPGQDREPAPGRGLVPLAVGVDRVGQPLGQLLEHGGDPLGLGLRAAAAHHELDCLVPLGDELLRLAEQVGRVRAQRPQHVDCVPLQPPEQLVHRLAQALAGDVPHRHFDRRLGEVVGCGHRLHPPDGLVHPAHPSGAQRRAQVRVDRHLDRLDRLTAPPGAAAGDHALAQAGQPVGGAHLDHDTALPAHLHRADPVRPADGQVDDPGGDG
jgi:hypothetical protein